MGKSLAIHPTYPNLGGRLDAVLGAQGWGIGNSWEIGREEAVEERA
jgi:hypothetical protein